MLLLVILTPYWAVTKNGPLDRKKEIEINSNYRNRAAKSNNVEDFLAFSNGRRRRHRSFESSPIESRPQGERGHSYMT